MITNIYPTTKLPKHATPPRRRKNTIANIGTKRKNKSSSTAVFDSGATSNCGRIGDDFQVTDEPSNKIFHLPNGQTATASSIVKHKLNLREPARTVHIVSDLKHNSRISASKFADANYIIILTPTEVLIYDGNGLQLEINHEAILRG